MSQASTQQSRIDLLTVALRDAHALGGQALELCRRQVERLRNYPEMSARLNQHIEETKVQRDRVARCLDTLNSDPSTLKNVALQLAANLQAGLHSLAGDEVLKNLFASYAFEHFEIASYRSLVTMAENTNHNVIAELCQQNLEEEEAMAAWLGDHIAEITQTYMNRASTGQEAKR